MNMLQKTDVRKLSPFRVFTVVTILIVLVLAPFYFYEDAKDRNRFKVNNTEVETIYEGSLKAQGAISFEKVNTNYKPILIGDGFWESLACIDQTCPQVTKQWAVPIEPGAEQSFLVSVAEKNGYTVTHGTKLPCGQDLDPCDVFAEKEGFDMIISAGEIQKATSVFPQTTDSKVWRNVSVWIALRPDELGI